MRFNPFNEAPERYDSWFDAQPALFKAESALIKRFLGGRAPALEVGTGTGRFAAVCGVDVGVDPALNALLIAKERGVKVVCALGKALPFPSSFFDAVLINTVLCFVEDRKAFLLEAGRVLKKDGRLVLGFINRESKLGRVYTEKPGFFLKSARFLSVTDVLELLGQTGFTVIDGGGLFADTLKELSFEDAGFCVVDFAVICAKKP